MIEASFPKSSDGQRDRDNAVHCRKIETEQQFAERFRQSPEAVKFELVYRLPRDPFIKSVGVITLEKGGGFFRHCPQIRAWSDAKGITQTLHDGPAYLFIFDQQDPQRGE